MGPCEAASSDESTEITTPTLLDDEAILAAALSDNLTLQPESQYIISSDKLFSLSTMQSRTKALSKDSEDTNREKHKDYIAAREVHLHLLKGIQLEIQRQFSLIRQLGKSIEQRRSRVVSTGTQCDPLPTSTSPDPNYTVANATRHAGCSLTQLAVGTPAAPLCPESSSLALEEVRSPLAKRPKPCPTQLEQCPSKPSSPPPPVAIEPKLWSYDDGTRSNDCPPPDNLYIHRLSCYPPASHNVELTHPQESQTQGGSKSNFVSLPPAYVPSYQPSSPATGDWGRYSPIQWGVQWPAIDACSLPSPLNAPFPQKPNPQTAYMYPPSHQPLLHGFFPISGPTRAR